MSALRNWTRVLRPKPRKNHRRMVIFVLIHRNSKPDTHRGATMYLRGLGDSRDRNSLCGNRRYCLRCLRPASAVGSRSSTPVIPLNNYPWWSLEFLVATGLPVIIPSRAIGPHNPSRNSATRGPPPDAPWVFRRCRWPQPQRPRLGPGPWDPRPPNGCRKPTKTSLLIPPEWACYAVYLRRRFCSVKFNVNAIIGQWFKKRKKKTNTKKFGVTENAKNDWFYFSAFAEVFSTWNRCGKGCIDKKMFWVYAISYK